MAISDSLFLRLAAGVGSELADPFDCIGRARSFWSSSLPCQRKYVESNIDSDIQHQLDSITQQILSRTRLLRIIDNLGLYAQDRKHKSPDELVESMRKDIEIELSHSDDKKLSVVQYLLSRVAIRRWRSWRRAELANLFITENLEQRQTTFGEHDELPRGSTRSGAGKTRRPRSEIARIQRSASGRVADSDAEQPADPDRPAESVAGEPGLAEPGQAAKHLSGIADQLSIAPWIAGSKPGEAGGPVGLAAIDKELDQLKAQLADLTSHYTEKHPDVRKTKEQIARIEKTRERVIADMNNPCDTTPLRLRPLLRHSIRKRAPMLEMESQLKANRLEIANREAEIKDEQNKINQYQARLNMAPVMEQQFADITRDYDQSKTDYEALLAKKNQSEMSTDLEKTQQGEHFRMLDPPNLPVRPYKPNRLMLCGAGLAVGLVLGGGLVFGQEKLSGKVYSEREIKKIGSFRRDWRDSAD